MFVSHVGNFYLKQYMQITYYIEFSKKRLLATAGKTNDSIRFLNKQKSAEIDTFLARLIILKIQCFVT